MRSKMLSMFAMSSMLLLDDVPYVDISHKGNGIRPKNSRKKIKGKRDKSLKVRSNRRKAKMKR